MSQNLRKAIILIILLGLGIGACTRPRQITPTVEAPSGTPTEETAHSGECWRTAMTQEEMNLCARSDAQASAQKLESLIKELRLKLNVEQWAELQKLQGEWEQFRDQNCLWEKGLFDGGTIAPMAYIQCTDAYNIQRIERLKKFLCEGYGLTGPCEDSKKY